ncbi:MAG TPA: acyltransferase [Silvibacterium sp.]|nr:acyltransferase [Silvibacterium sp.]
MADTLSRDEATNSPVVHKSDDALSYWLDFFRWTAALSVVLAHTGNRFLVKITDVSPAHRSVAFYVFAFLAGFAHQAVMIFFVLSGYLVGGGLLREVQRKRSIDVVKYLVKRLTRLGVVLFPAFVLIALFNMVGIVGLHGLDTGVYPADTLTTMRASTLACNGAFLQNGFCHTYGEDGALWSLSNEFWYYIIWPLLILSWYAATKRNRALFTAVAVAMLIVFTIPFEGTWSMVGPYMLIWVLGAAVGWMKKPIISSVPLAAAVFLLTMLLIRLLVRRSIEMDHRGYQLFIDLALGCAFANLIATMRFSKNLKPFLWTKLNYGLAAFSFSLYCIHIPILNLYGAVLMHYTGTGWKMVPDQAWKWLVVFGAMIVAITGAFLFSRLTEVHTEFFRNLGLRTVEYFRRDKLAPMAISETKMQ